ncbi:MAG: M48 family metallopeptidase [Lentisphaerae bacterium]|nr:M48 family metallopeptidase [Lentisphaerota bacterium]
MRKSSLLMQTNNFRVIRSARRKTVSFRFSPDGILEIHAPLRFPLKQIRLLIANNQQLIADLCKRTPQKIKPDFSENAMFYLLGTRYPLHLTGRLLMFDERFMIPRSDEEHKKSSMITLYRQIAAKIISSRVEIFQKIMNLYPEKIRISSASTRWGSCSANKTLSFSWKLIQCPLECVDYVVVHELAHLAEMNHSPAFWQKVANVIPDYREKKQQLNAFAAQLPYWE